MTYKTTFHWYVKRGCATDKTSVVTGSSQAENIFGVTQTNYACTFQNGNQKRIRIFLLNFK